MTFEERHIRLLLWVALGLSALGLWTFVVRGADQPADPSFTPVTPGDPARVPLEGFDEIAISVAPAGGGDLLSWCLLAALRAEQQSRGLMGVTDLQGYSGMAFVYDSDVDHGFYMRNTPTPLSIAWIDPGGAIVSTVDMAPCEDREGCAIYSPAGPYRVAIEVFQGGLGGLGITQGAKVTVGGACAARA